MNSLITLYAAGYVSIMSLILMASNLSLFQDTAAFDAVFSLQLFVLVAFSSIFIVNSLVKEKDNALKQLRRKAEHDVLTNLYNRQFFSEILEKEMALAERYQAPFCLLMFDIDNFKSINDNYGHLIGDKVLVELSTFVLKKIRKADSFCRWGGEEFMILMPNTRLQEAHVFAERLREAISSKPAVTAKTITVSIGVTEYSRKTTTNTLLDQVDKAMYLAKTHGKNRVEQYSSQLIPTV